MRALQVVLDPGVSSARVSAFHDYLFDTRDPKEWLGSLRDRAAAICPSRVILVRDFTEMRSALVDADAVVVERMPIGAGELASASRLRLVQKFGIDLRNIDLEACGRAGVPVRSLRRRVNAAVAEHAILLMLAVARKLVETAGAIDFASLQKLGYRPALFDSDHVAGANWARITGLRSLFGATLGILGLGEIGREVATRARAMGMDIIYHQRTSVEGFSDAEFVSFEVLFQRADYVGVFLPLGPDTRDLVDACALSCLKPGAILVNVSRAEIVNRDALIEALESGRLAGAGLDVHYEEPAVADEPLRDYPNVVLSPHIAVGPRRHNMDDIAELTTSLAECLAPDLTLPEAAKSPP